MQGNSWADREDFRTRDKHTTLIEDSKNVRAVDTVLDATNSGSSVHCLVPVIEPVQQGNWVTVRRHSRRSKHRSSVPIKTSNRLYPLRNLMKVL